jgi:predicted flap endonuclease-1-like 5' DNA nuclease
MNKPSLVGSAGGSGGAAFQDLTFAPSARIAALRIGCGQYIESIEIVLADGTALSAGGHAGITRTAEFRFDFGEVLLGISGRSGWYIDSLQLHTSQRVSDVFGGPGGDSDFAFTIPAGHAFAGFGGRADWFIDALGLLARPAATAAPAPTTPPAKPTPAAPRVARSDDLIKVEGIGPKIAQLLIGAGILDLQDLSVAPVARLRDILKNAGSRYAMADPTTWPEQAALGAKGDWAAFEALQKRLNKGRVAK